jgi:hypothetical protein
MSDIYVSCSNLSSNVPIINAKIDIDIISQNRFIHYSSQFRQLAPGETNNLFRISGTDIAEIATEALKLIDGNKSEYVKHALHMIPRIAHVMGKEISDEALLELNLGVSAEEEKEADIVPDVFQYVRVLSDQQIQLKCSVTYRAGIKGGRPLGVKKKVIIRPRVIGLLTRDDFQNGRYGLDKIGDAMRTLSDELYSWDIEDA